MTTRKPSRPRAALASWTAACAALLTLGVRAADNPPASTTPADDEVVKLNPFEVKSDSDTSYGALQSNSLTSFRMDLAKAPATAEVFTQTFMDDIAATSIEEVLTGYTGTVTASSNNPGAALDAPGDRDGSQGLSIRGVAVADIKRDGFIGPQNKARTASGSTDNFDIERIEKLEGPQSILYGSVGGGGVINTVSKRAQFNKQNGSFRYMIDQYGTKRGLLDYNYGSKRAAVRVALVGADDATNRYKLGGKFDGIYLQAAVQPLSNTTIRFSTEKTDYDARVGFKPSNLNNFLSATDPRRNKDTRYLALTNQIGDLHIIDGPLDYGNIESLGSWWSSERIINRWSNMVVESTFAHGFSAQLTAVYSETLDDRDTDGRNLLPGQGSLLPDGTPNKNAGANPFSVTAMQIGSPVRINEQRDRNKGVRLALLHEHDFDFWKLHGHSQTAIGGQAYHRGPAFGSSGIAEAYYQADSNWNVLYKQADGTQGTTPNYGLTDYGRTALPFIYFPVQGGIPSKPVFRPGQARVTYNGQNYVLMPRIISDPTHVSPANPFGLVPNNNVTTGTFTDQWNRGGETHSGNVYAANVTDWFDGRLTTLLGFSITRFETLNVGPGSSLAQPAALTPTPKANYPGWQAGFNYGITHWLRFYAVSGTAETAEASTTDIYGNPLKNPKANNLTPELGFKASTADGKFLAQLSWDPTTKTLNENRNTGDTSFKDAINPAGINGRLGGGAANQRVNVDRTLESVELVLTANPTHNWRMRMTASHLTGQILNTVAYDQLYNDQFTVSGQNVMYTDGTPVLVDPTGNIKPGANPTQQLTLGMINTVGGLYYANPDPTSGRILNTTLQSVLLGTTPYSGGRTSATGVVGLPISQVQYNFTSPYPNGHVVIYQAGEKNTGFNENVFNFQNRYEFSSGILRGVAVFGDVQTYWKNRAYYVNYPGASGSTLGTQVTRQLYRLPTATTVNLGISYKHRGLPWLGGRYTWITQLNVRNALNHYRVWVVPNTANGSVLNARLSALPRTFIWTNTIEF